MDIDRFWDLIEQARVSAGPVADQAVRDFDEPDDDPDRDYWDFEDLDLQAALSVNESVNGHGLGAGPESDPGGIHGAPSGPPVAATEHDGDNDDDDTTMRTRTMRRDDEERTMRKTTRSPIRWRSRCSTC